MKHSKALFLTAIFTFHSEFSYANDLSGNNFLEVCAPELSVVAPLDRATCDLLLMKTLKQNRLLESAKEKIICIPQEATYLQGILIVRKYMKDNPGVLHFTLENIAVLAMSETFPCK